MFLQCDESYRFCAHANVLPSFTLLHIVVESILSPHNIQREKSNILKYYLEQISVNKQLCDKWNELLTPGTDAVTSVVLQRIVIFFLKSKQQIFREKEGLKPNKNSVSLSQQVKGSKSVSKSSKLPVMKNPEITMRNDFTVPTIEKFLCHLKTLPLEESETIFSNLQGKELAKI